VTCATGGVFVILAARSSHAQVSLWKSTQYCRFATSMRYDTRQLEMSGNRQAVVSLKASVRLGACGSLNLATSLQIGSTADLYSTTCLVRRKGTRYIADLILAAQWLQDTYRGRNRDRQ